MYGGMVTVTHNAKDGDNNFEGCSQITTARPHLQVLRREFLCCIKYTVLCGMVTFTHNVKDGDNHFEAIHRY